MALASRPIRLNSPRHGPEYAQVSAAFEDLPFFRLRLALNHIGRKIDEAFEHVFISHQPFSQVVKRGALALTIWMCHVGLSSVACVARLLAAVQQHV